MYRFAYCKRDVFKFLELKDRIRLERVSSDWELIHAWATDLDLTSLRSQQYFTDADVKTVLTLIGKSVNLKSLIVPRFFPLDFAELGKFPMLTLNGHARL